MQKRLILIKSELKKAVKRALPAAEIKSVLLWYLKNKPVPPPNQIKRKIIKEYAKKYSLNTFIETGTYFGDTVEVVKKNFASIISIELDRFLHEKARNRFLNNKNIEIIQGDSGEILWDILKKIKEPCLFWLDGHYSCGITAKGKSNTPILKELEAILSHKIKDHVLLIDDARCFTGKDDYPDIDELKKIIQNRGDLNFEVKNDVIRIFSNEYVENNK